MAWSWKCLHLCYSEFPARAEVFLVDVSSKGLRCITYAHYSSFVRITCHSVEGWADPRFFLRTWCMKKECSGLSKTRNMIFWTSKWFRVRALGKLGLQILRTQLVPPYRTMVISPKVTVCPVFNVLEKPYVTLGQYWFSLSDFVPLYADFVPLYDIFY